MLTRDKLKKAIESGQPIENMQFDINAVYSDERLLSFSDGSTNEYETWAHESWTLIHFSIFENKPVAVAALLRKDADLSIPYTETCRIERRRPGAFTEWSVTSTTNNKVITPTYQLPEKEHKDQGLLYSGREVTEIKEMLALHEVILRYLAIDKIMSSSHSFPADLMGLICSFEPLNENIQNKPTNRLIDIAKKIMPPRFSTSEESKVNESQNKDEPTDRPLKRRRIEYRYHTPSITSIIGSMFSSKTSLLQPSSLIATKKPSF